MGGRTAKPLLKPLSGEFSLCKIADLSMVDFEDRFMFLTKTDRDISLVCRCERIPPNAINIENGWKALMIEGELPQALTTVTQVLAREQIDLFAVSTFDSDYIFLKTRYMDQAVDSLNAADYKVG